MFLQKLLPAQEFAAFCDEAGMAICWGSAPEELSAAGCTTYNARTYLQPQLNKAVGRAEVAGSTHRHLKDYLLCYASLVFLSLSLSRSLSLSLPPRPPAPAPRPRVSAYLDIARLRQGAFSNTLKDNTGKGPGHYEEDLVFPTLSFPSDHGTVSSQVRSQAYGRLLTLIFAH